MRTRSWLHILVLSGFAAGALAATAAATYQAPGSAVHRVLFIGNSYTYFNNLPCLVQALAADTGVRLETTMIAEGGQTLGGLLQKPETRRALARNWDAVVLQTQSTFGETYLVDGLNRIAGTRSLLAESRPYVEALRAGGARVFLYAHWRRRDAPQRDQDAIHRAFGEAAQALSAAVIPAGLAWEIAGSAIPPGSLYDADGSHPSAEGSYLTALAAVEAITGRRPAARAVPGVTCPAIDHDGTPAPSSTRPVDVPEALRGTLATAAARAITEWPGAATRTVPPIDVPAVPEGEPAGGPIAGEWRGQTRLYPRGMTWPASMTLSVIGPDHGRLTISFGGQPDDIIRRVTLRIAGSHIEFEDTQGPSGTVVKYRGVRRGNTLSGIAEFTGNPSVYGIGRWTLTR